MADEIWRPIPGYEGLYEASNAGRVRSLRCIVKTPRGTRTVRDRVLKPSPDTHGYPSVVLARLGTRYKVKAATLVLRAFVGLAPAGMEGCHDNGIRSDSRLENLRWDTRLGNQADRKKHGTDIVGERHGMAKLHPDDVAQIRMMRGMAPKIAIGRLFGIGESQTSRIMNGTAWSHLA